MTESVIIDPAQTWVPVDASPGGGTCTASVVGLWGPGAGRGLQAAWGPGGKRQAEACG